MGSTSRFTGFFRRRKAEKFNTEKEAEVTSEDAALGVAIDIGTTTLAAELWDIEEKKSLARTSSGNPQTLYGSDIISRIVFCGRRFGNLKIIRNTLINDINLILEELCRTASVSTDRITRVVACGNTVMSHIFLGYNPESLSKAPFTPEYKGVISRNACEEGLMTSKEGILTVIPNIAGHVGGDILAGIIASGIADSDKLSLFVDIGTNGEIVLSGEKTYVCSAAAGPAFEGASIKCGMRSVPGAIKAVDVDEEHGVSMKTADGGIPCGICGSGLVDLVSVFLDNGIIDKTGKITEGSHRVREGDDGREILIISEKEIRKLAEFSDWESDDEIKDIVFTQKDVRELQLAKAAISAGIAVLLMKAEKDVSDIERVILTGAFGCAMDPSSAMNIGLLPEFSKGIIEMIDDAALSGTSELLLSQELMERAVRIPDDIEHVELADSDDFRKMFMAEIGFK